MKDYTTLFRLFEDFAYPNNTTTALTEILDCFLLAFRWHEGATGQIDARKKLSEHPKPELLSTVFTEIGELAEDFGDPLGALFETMVSKGRNGQFLTPEHIATMLARLSITPETSPGQSICDPACGSGRLLLAAAKINRHLRFYGADIDELCCKISAVNLLLNSLSGEIAHMDTLSNHFYKGYKIATTLYKGHYYPYVIEFTNSEESYIWSQPLKWNQSPQALANLFEPTKSVFRGQGVQGSLFDE